MIRKSIGSGSSRRRGLSRVDGVPDLAGDHQSFPARNNTSSPVLAHESRRLSSIPMSSGSSDSSLKVLDVCRSLSELARVARPE